MKDRDGQGKEAFRKREPTGLWSVMYPAHFGLRENPFATDADPKYLWLGEKRKEALATLVHRILYGDGVQVVIGNPGTGKTSLADAVLEELGDRVLATVVSCPEYKGVDFLKLIERTCGISGTLQTQNSFYSRFSEFLHRSISSGHKVVLIIDDAHRLNASCLKELSDLSIIEENGTRLLRLVFFGENRFLDLLNEESNLGLSESAIYSYALEPLTKDETAQFIRHHLQIAQCEREMFTPDAIEEIFLYSQGVPRLINRACDAALSRVFYLGEQQVLPDTVKDSVKLMPVEKTVLAGTVPGLSFEMNKATEREREESDPDDDEPVIPTGYARKRSRNWIAYTVLGCITVASIGVVFFFMKSNEQRVPSSVTSNKIEVPPASTAAQSTTPPTEETDREAAMSAREQAPDVSVGEKTRKVAADSGARKKTRETVASRSSAGKPRQAPAASPRREDVTSEGVSPGRDTGRSTSGDSGETASREPPRRDTEEMDSGKVIDWLIKIRSEQK